MLKQPEDRVIEWSPGYIWHLAEYALNFKFLGMDPIQPGSFTSELKQREKRLIRADRGMVSIDDIIPI